MYLNGRFAGCAVKIICELRQRILNAAGPLVPDVSLSWSCANRSPARRLWLGVSSLLVWIVDFVYLMSGACHVKVSLTIRLPKCQQNRTYRDRHYAKSLPNVALLPSYLQKVQITMIEC